MKLTTKSVVRSTAVLMPALVKHIKNDIVMMASVREDRYGSESYHGIVVHDPDNYTDGVGTLSWFSVKYYEPFVGTIKITSGE